MTQNPAPKSFPGFDEGRGCRVDMYGEVEQAQMAQILAGFERAKVRQAGQIFLGLEGAQREGQQSHSCRIAEIVGGVEQSEESYLYLLAAAARWRVKEEMQSWGM